MSGVEGTALERGGVALAQERGTDQGAQGKGGGGGVRLMEVGQALVPVVEKVGEGAVVGEEGEGCQGGHLEGVIAIAR